MQANENIAAAGEFADDTLTYRPYPDQPTVHLRAADARWEADPDWFYNFQFPREEERGLDASEDLFTPGRLRLVLEPGTTAGLVVADEANNADPAALLAAEIDRRQCVALPAPIASDLLLARLARSADQFLVPRGDGLHTLLAGYHWFTDWGRDTMIALPGICLVTGRHTEAKNIFQAFAAHVSAGMIPNRFPDVGEEPEYNTVDATLWFFSTLYKYLRYTGDYDFAKEFWPTLKEIVAWHRTDTRYGIRVDADGLLTAGEEGVQLTWMDAKVGDWVVTPRIGKPVEINALWYNALKIMEHLALEFGADADYGADQVHNAFSAQFWNADCGGLFDLLTPCGPDPAIRPNQLFALSLPFALVEGERAAQILALVEEHLLTPRGLRSLSPADPAYRAHYCGGPRERDGAYHQGIVWGWLIGPYLTALCRVHGAAGRERHHRRFRQPPAGSGPRLDLRGLRRRAALRPARVHSAGLERGRVVAGGSRGRIGTGTGLTFVCAQQFQRRLVDPALVVALLAVLQRRHLAVFVHPLVVGVAEILADCRPDFGIGALFQQGLHHRRVLLPPAHIGLRHDRVE